MQITSDIELSGAGCTTAITPNQLVQSSSENDMLWSSFFGHADQMVGLCTGGQLGGRAGQRFVL
ncbi:hypothetical protein, partial [Pseudomonas aeruginosa]|uniref:hypothetical protein n=1 Tax=Pseudomonas aeruginosa TaxID=287 RepID=UPI00397A8F9E